MKPEASHSNTAGGRIASSAALFLAYLGLAVLFTYPLVYSFTTHHAGEGGGDAPVYVWNMWWVKESLLELHQSPLATGHIYHPVGIGLGLHTLGLTQGLLFIPLSCFLGDVLAVNVVVLATFVVSALATFALARHFGADRSGAFLAGIAFAFCPYRLARLAGHYDLLSTEWIPLFLLVFAKTLARPQDSKTMIALAAVLAASCGYANLSYLVFLALLVLVFVIAHVLRQPDARRALMRTSLMLALAGVLLLPLFIAIIRDLSRWTYPPYPGSERYSADLASYFLPGPKQSLLGGLIGCTFDRNLTESVVFPGYLPWLLGAFALLHPRLRRTHAVWIVSGALFFVLSLGPVLRVTGRATGVPLPFALLQRLPLLHNLRAPSRFSLLVVLSLAILAAASWTALVPRLRRRSTRIMATIAAASVLAAELIAIPSPIFPAAIPGLYHAIGRQSGDFAVVEIPGIDQVPGRLMHHQTAHGKRIFIGFCARVPIEKSAYYAGLPLVRPLVDLRKRKIALDDALVEGQRASAPHAARFLEIRYFVIEHSFAKRGLSEFLERVLPVERMAGDEERDLLRVREEALPPLPWTLEAGADESRLYYESGWTRPIRIEGRSCRSARGTRSTVLLRRPERAPLGMRLLVHAPADLVVELRLDDARLGRLRLTTGWNARRLTLPRASDAFAERLWLLWNPSDEVGTEPPAVAEIRFERGAAPAGDR